MAFCEPAALHCRRGEAGRSHCELPRDPSIKASRKKQRKVARKILQGRFPPSGFISFPSCFRSAYKVEKNTKNVSPNREKWPERFSRVGSPPSASVLLCICFISGKNETWAPWKKDLLKKSKSCRFGRLSGLAGRFTCFF